MLLIDASWRAFSQGQIRVWRADTAKVFTKGVFIQREKQMFRDFERLKKLATMIRLMARDMNLVNIMAKQLRWWDVSQPLFQHSPAQRKCGKTLYFLLVGRLQANANAKYHKSISKLRSSF